MEKKIKIALALGGGGAKGVAHIGVIKVLQREGFAVGALAGTSVGACVGAALAAGLTIDELEDKALTLTKNWNRLIKPGFKNSLISNKGLLDYLDTLFHQADFEDIVIPLKIVAADLASGKEIIIKNGSLAEAALASSSIPGILPPIKMGSRYLVDGGVVNQTPVNVAQTMNADLVVAVDLMLNTKFKKNDYNIIDCLTESYKIIRLQSVKFSLNKADDNFVLIRPSFEGLVDTFKFTNIKKFIAAGERAAKRALPRIYKYLEKK